MQNVKMVMFSWVLGQKLHVCSITQLMHEYAFFSIGLHKYTNAVVLN